MTDNPEPRRSTPLQRLNEAAERIRASYQNALNFDNERGMRYARDAAAALGLEIGVDNDGRVTVGRPQREEA